LQDYASLDDLFVKYCNTEFLDNMIELMDPEGKIYMLPIERTVNDVFIKSGIGHLMNFYELETNHILHVHYVNGNKFEFRGFSLSGEEMDYIKDLSNSTWGGSSHLSEFDDEEAHDEEDYYFSMVKN